MVCPCNKCLRNEGLAEQYKQAAEVRQVEIEKLLEREHACDVCAKVSPNVVVLCDDCDPTVEGDLGGVGSGVRAVHEKMSAEIDRFKEKNRAYMLQAQDLRRRIEVLEVELDNERRARSAALDVVERLEHGVVIHSVNIPDWQDGAPSAAQLDKWKWWALEWQGVDERGIILQSIFPSSDDWISITGHEWNREMFTRSAPIQPDLTNGPLWVPLEVANG